MEYVLEIIICTLDTKESTQCLQELEHNRVTFSSMKRCQRAKYMQFHLKSGLISGGMYGTMPKQIEAKCIPAMSS